MSTTKTEFNLRAGKNIRRFREARGMSQRELGEELGKIGFGAYPDQRDDEEASADAAGASARITEIGCPAGCATSNPNRAGSRRDPIMSLWIVALASTQVGPASGRSCCGAFGWGRGLQRGMRGTDATSAPRASARPFRPSLVFCA